MTVGYYLGVYLWDATNVLLMWTSWPPDADRASVARQRGQAEQRAPRPCYFWMRGRCDKGHECRFQHEGVEPSTRDTICKFFRMGNCDKVSQRVAPPAKLWQLRVAG